MILNQKLIHGLNTRETIKINPKLNECNLHNCINSIAIVKLNKKDASD